MGLVSLVAIAVAALLFLLLFGLAVRAFGGGRPSGFWANLGLLVALAVVLFGAVGLTHVVVHLLGRRIREKVGRHVKSLYSVVPTAAIGAVVLVPGFTPPAAMFSLSQSDVGDLLGDLEAPRYVPPEFVDDVAFRHRPLLYFDSREPFRPQDVDALLGETAPAGESSHRWCERATGAPDACREVRSVEDVYVAIRNARTTYLDLGKTTSDESATDQRIYYQVVEEGPLVHLDYWWFFRYNRSPIRSEWFCLAGLSIASATCFDHEGDWEGVTVTLREGSGPISVTYTGHHWPGYRYSWKTLEALGQTEASHPRVYVAFGSHASYPVPCGGRERSLLGGCDQLDFRHEVGSGPVKRGVRVPEGRHDGGAAWSMNDDEACAASGCVSYLPVTWRGRPTSWNAYDGFWGRAECAAIPTFCMRIDGPRSPGLQARFDNPGRSESGSLEELVRHQAAARS